MKALAENKRTNLNAINKGGDTALIFAALNNNVDAVAALLDAGADADVVEHEYGKTALLYAAHNGHVSVIKALAKRANLNAVDMWHHCGALQTRKSRSGARAHPPLSQLAREPQLAEASRPGARHLGCDTSVVLKCPRP